MTTIVAIKAFKEDKPVGIVLCSDLQATYQETVQVGRDTFRVEERKRGADKISFRPEGNIALSVAGSYHEKADEIIKSYLTPEGEEKFLKELDTSNVKSFAQVNLNHATASGLEIDTKEQAHLLVCTRKPEFGIMAVAPLGKVITLGTSGTLGSGYKLVEDYLSVKGFKLDRPPSPEDSIRLASESMEYATSKDLHSQGLNLVVLTERGIISERKRIMKAMNAAFDNTLDEIVKSNFNS